MRAPRVVFATTCASSCGDVESPSCGWRGRPIELPPGDFVSTKVAQLEATGQRVNQEMVDALRLQYGLDKPVYLRYLTWMRLLSGNAGTSLES